MFEDLRLVGRFREFICEVLSGEMLALMQAGTPLRAVSDIIYQTVERYPQARAAFTGVTAQFHYRNDPILEMHGAIIQSTGADREADYS